MLNEIHQKCILNAKYSKMNIIKKISNFFLKKYYFYRLKKAKKWQIHKAKYDFDDDYTPEELEEYKTIIEESRNLDIEEWMDKRKELDEKIKNNENII